MAAPDMILKKISINLRRLNLWDSRATLSQPRTQHGFNRQNHKTGQPLSQTTAI
jgi:hypothetical protein